MKADGGLIRLQTDLTKNLYDLAVNNSGVVQANSLASDDGYIELITADLLSSNNNGHVLNSGSIASSGNAYLQVSTLDNSGSISSNADVNILALGSRTITRNDPDGTLATLDNKRVFAGQLTNTNVKVNVYNFDAPIPNERIGGTLIYKDQIPTTYGEAITNRIKNQGSGWSSDNPYGSSKRPTPNYPHNNP